MKSDWKQTNVAGGKIPNLAEAWARGSQPPNPAKQTADNIEPGCASRSSERGRASPKVSYLRYNKQENMAAAPASAPPAPRSCQGDATRAPPAAACPGRWQLATGARAGATWRRHRGRAAIF